MKKKKKKKRVLTAAIIVGSISKHSPIVIRVRMCVCVLRSSSSSSPFKHTQTDTTSNEPVNSLSPLQSSRGWRHSLSDGGFSLFLSACLHQIVAWTTDAVCASVRSVPFHYDDCWQCLLASFQQLSTTRQTPHSASGPYYWQSASKRSISHFFFLPTTKQLRKTKKSKANWQHRQLIIGSRSIK